MSLYNDIECKNLIERVEDIMKDADNISSKKIRPTIDELWDIVKTVFNFVKEKKRKVYGGFALNKLIEAVSKEDMFYSNDDVKSWDIDFYSPTPIDDAIEISDRLHKKGYGHIKAGEALHEETYTIFAETNNCADISYVPRNIYNKIPFIEINGVCLTGPHFMMIDYFRVMTDPLTSYFRLEKTFKRLCLMMKHYPLPHNTKRIEQPSIDRDLDIALRTVHNFMIKKESMINVGIYAYNHLIHESGITTNITKSKPGNNRVNGYINYLYTKYYEIISTNYNSDTRDLILALQDKFSINKNKITYTENYPFFQYIGYNVDIYYDNNLICQIYHYNKRCTPYIDVPALYFNNSSFEEDNKSTIRIGSLATQMMYNLINIMRARTINDTGKKDLHYTIISHIIDMKNYFLNRTKKTIFDKSLFQEFILNCVGETNTATMEKALRIDKKIKLGKKYTWSYNPSNRKDKNNEVRYIFKNSSGNQIKNDKNIRINLNCLTNSDGDDIEQDEDEDNDEKS